MAAHAGPSTRRHFSASARRSAAPVGHYDALSLPHNATKQQIKARFYELSKRHHPDAQGGDTAKFHQINDAYATLGDETKRRQYDNSMRPSRPSHGPNSEHSGYHPHSPHLRTHSSGPHRSWGRAGAAPRRPGGGQTSTSGGAYNPFGRRASPDYNTGPSPGSYPGGNAYSRAASEPFGRGPTGRRQTRTSTSAREDEEGGGGESGLWRFGLVVGLLLAVVGFGGGITASADTGEAESWAKEEHKAGRSEGAEAQR